MSKERREVHDAQALKWQKLGRNVVAAQDDLRRSILLDPAGRCLLHLKVQYGS